MNARLELPVFAGLPNHNPAGEVVLTEAVPSKVAGRGRWAKVGESCLGGGAGGCMNIVERTVTGALAQLDFRHRATQHGVPIYRLYLVTRVLCNR